MGRYAGLRRDQLASASLDALPPPEATDWASLGDAPLDASGGDYLGADGAGFLAI